MKLSDAYQLLFTWLAVLLYLGSASRSAITSDARRWISMLKPERQGRPDWTKVSWLVFRYPEFRSLLYYRLRTRAGLPARLLLKVCAWAVRPTETLIFDTPEIGPGLFIQHGFATIIAARRIGSDCLINQQVTIGYSAPGKCPTIGNNVRISAGAKVIGSVTVGDNVIIGANAVVVKDVPENCTVVGVPAYIVRRNGQKVAKEARN